MTRKSAIISITVLAVLLAAALACIGAFAGLRPAAVLATFKGEQLYTESQAAATLADLEQAVKEAAKKAAEDAALKGYEAGVEVGKQSVPKFNLGFNSVDELIGREYKSNNDWSWHFSAPMSEVYEPIVVGDNLRDLYFKDDPALLKASFEELDWSNANNYVDVNNIPESNNQCLRLIYYVNPISQMTYFLTLNRTVQNGTTYYFLQMSGNQATGNIIWVSDFGFSYDGTIIEESSYWSNNFHNTVFYTSSDGCRYMAFYQTATVVDDQQAIWGKVISQNTVFADSEPELGYGYVSVLNMPAGEFGSADDLFREHIFNYNEGDTLTIRFRLNSGERELSAQVVITGDGSMNATFEDGDGLQLELNGGFIYLGDLFGIPGSAVSLITTEAVTDFCVLSIAATPGAAV